MRHCGTEMVDMKNGKRCSVCGKELVYHRRKLDRRGERKAEKSLYSDLEMQVGVKGQPTSQDASKGRFRDKRRD